MNDVESGAEETQAQDNVKPTQVLTQAETPDYWKGKYNGLQGHNQKLQNQHAKLREEFEGAREGYEGKLSELELQVKTLSQKSSLAEKESQTLRTERDKLVAEKATRIVVKNHEIASGISGLVDLYDDGLMLGIESLGEEDRTAYLGRMTERLIQRSNEVRDTLNAGRTPPAATTNEKVAGETRDEVFQRLMTLPPGAEYDAAYKTYLSMPVE